MSGIARPLHLLDSLAEVERELICERTHTGLTSAQAQGRVSGHQWWLPEEAERTAILAKTLYRVRQLGVNEIASCLHISQDALY